MELHIPHVTVEPVSCEKLVVGPLFSHLTILQHDDFIGISNGSQPMSNHQNSPLIAKAIKRLLDAVLCQSVQ